MAASEPEPEPAPDLEMESESVLDPESDSETAADPEPESDSDTEPEPAPDLEMEPEPDPDPELEPEPESDADPELEPNPESASSSDQTPDSELASEPDTEPDSKHELSTDAEAETVAESISDYEPEPEPEPEPTPKPEPEAYREPETSANPYLEVESDVGQDEATTSPDSVSAASGESKPSISKRIHEFAQASLDLVRRDKRVKIAVIALLAALVLIVGITQISSCERMRSERERAAAEQRRLSSLIDTGVTVVAANYDAEHGTPIPLHVVGDAKSGAHVDEIVTVDVRDPKLALLPGTYVVTAGGSLATDQGAFYHGSVDSYAVEVSEKQSSASDGNDSTADAPTVVTPVFAYELVAPEHVTDADLEALRGWMAVANVKDSQRYIDAVTTRRAEAQQRIAQEDAARDEEERARTEETAREVEEALQSNTQAGSDRVSFSVPESWRGSVQTTQSVGSTGYAVTIVHLPGNQYAELARVFFSSGYVGAGADGTFRHVAAYRNSSDGTGHAEAQTLNWPLIAAMGAESQYGVSQAELYMLVSLSTGGAVSCDYARSAGGYDVSVSQAEPNFSSVAFSSLAAI